MKNINQKNNSIQKMHFFMIFLFSISSEKISSENEKEKEKIAFGYAGVFRFVSTTGFDANNNCTILAIPCRTINHAGVFR